MPPLIRMRKPGNEPVNCAEEMVEQLKALGFTVDGVVNHPEAVHEDVEEHEESYPLSLDLPSIQKISEAAVRNPGPVKKDTLIACLMALGVDPPDDATKADLTMRLVDRLREVQEGRA